MTRKSILVSKIDTDKLGEILHQRAVDAGQPDVYPEAEPMVVLNTEQGIATVCSEGVGWFKGEKGYLVGGYVGYSNPTFYLSDDELFSVISNDVIQLDEFIRSFGSRLEANYSIWYSEAEGYSQHPLRIKEELLKCPTPVVV